MPSLKSDVAQFDRVRTAQIRTRTMKTWAAVLKVKETEKPLSRQKNFLLPSCY